MIELKVILLNSLFCFGAYFSFIEGNILGGISRIYEMVFMSFDKDGNPKLNLGYYLSKPLYSCVVCMASIWGIIFVYFSGMAEYDIISWMFLIHVVVLAGVNHVIVELLENLKGF